MAEIMLSGEACAASLIWGQVQAKGELAMQGAEVLCTYRNESGECGLIRRYAGDGRIEQCQDPDRAEDIRNCRQMVDKSNSLHSMPLEAFFNELTKDLEEE